MYKNKRLVAIASPYKIWIHDVDRYDHNKLPKRKKEIYDRNKEAYHNTTRIHGPFRHAIETRS